MKSPAPFLLRLYIAGKAKNSRLAVRNLEAICKNHFPHSPKIEVIDLLTEPGRALKDKILLTPTLVKVFPPPMVSIVGNLSDTSAVLQAFDLSS